MALPPPSGPRLAGRLTADLILSSPQGFNAVKDYSIDLRGHKLSSVDNLAVTQNQFDCVDLSDNELVKLEGFPPLKRLSTLLVHNNRITRLSPALGAALPKLETLGLANNRLANLGDLAPLASLSRLCRLDLTGNPVTKKPQYRLYLISLLPRLKLLDFSRIRDSERAEAAAAFGGADGAARAAALAADARSAAAVEEGSTLASDGKRSQAPTQNQLLAIKAAIANASTLEEVQRLEKALQSGVMPSELANGGQHAGDGGQAAMDEG